jgi:hypothetical protein
MGYYINMKVRDLFQVLKNTNFRSFFINNPDDNGVPSLSEDTQTELLEVQEFTLNDFGSWQYGISNYGTEGKRFKFIIQLIDDEGETVTKTKFKDSLGDILKDENILEMEVVEIKSLSLEGEFNVSTTNTAWPSNDASIEIVVTKSK